jgi:hypothetical protein
MKVPKYVSLVTTPESRLSLNWKKITNNRGEEKWHQKLYQSPIMT